ncbi:MAG TPA: tetratricopeptide repeat protein [Thermodesulfobacteriota bacterium]|nr:tetratricopeptide repeat protein [Thermodesulfobacteriota bacterium]
MFSLLVGAYLLQATYIDLYNKGHELLAEGRAKEAEVLLHDSASLNPNYAPALKDLAESYVKLRNFSEAIDNYKKVVELDPRDINSRARLAELYSWDGNYDRAIVTYRDALELDPGNKLLLNGLAVVLRWSHRYDEAERLYREVLSTDAENHEALKGLGKTYSMTGDLSKAVEVFEKAISLYPDDSELHKDMGTVLAWQKDFKKAIASLERAVEIFPNYAEAYRTMGDVYSWMRAYRQAEDSYKKAVDIEPGSLENHMLLAKLYRNTERLKLAEDEVKAALRIDPTDTSALELFRDIRNEGKYSVVKLLSEALEIGSYATVFLIVLAVSRTKRKMLKRKHRAYLCLVSYVLPSLVLITLVSYVWQSYIGEFLNISFLEDLSEAALFFSFGVSFLTLLWTEKKSKDFSKTVILAVGAHPDDIELGCGGLIMKAKDSGATVYGITMSKGEKGALENGNRESELKKAAAFMELDGFWVMDFPDTGLEGCVAPMKDAIEEKIKETGATMVLTHTAIDIHSDHRAVFDATKVAARNISVLCYEDVSTPREFVPNYFVDVTSYINDKMRTIGFHRTQEDKNYMNPEVIRGRAAHRGIQAGVEFAEAYRIYKLLR